MTERLREGSAGMTGVTPPGRLLRLHVASRRVPAAILCAAVLAAVLRVLLPWLHDAGFVGRMVPLLVETGVAGLVGAATRSPFGDSERVAGGYLPALRLMATLGLVGIGAVVLAAGSTAGHLPDGTGVVLRDYLGLTGVALLSAVFLGGGLCWAGPLTYTVLNVIGLNASWTTLWLWPLRAGTDRGALACALALLTIGVGTVAARGAHDAGEQ